MTLQAWLDKIQNIHPVGLDLGLERVGLVVKRLNVLKPAKTIFLVAGTNGKGSTCEYLAKLSEQLHLNYGKATSPFLQSYNEQIVINGAPVTDAQLVHAFTRIDTARGETTLTQFEFGALAALLIFTEADLDVAILEIGLGGRLDAMNSIDPDVAIITRIALDHQQWLGADRETIAIEKAGIMRAQKPVVIVDPEPPASLFKEAAIKGAQVFCLGEDFHYRQQMFINGSLSVRLTDLKLPEYSAVAAIQAMLCAGFALRQDQVMEACFAAQLPGRFQVLNRKPKVILDVAHNPDAAQLLVARLRARGLTDLHGIVAMYADKNIESILLHLVPYITTWHFCDLPMLRAVKAETLNHCLQAACGLSGQVYAKVADAYDVVVSQLKHSCQHPQSVRSHHAESGILVFGSFPVVAAVLDHLQNPVL